MGWLEPTGRALHGPTVDHLLARPVGIERLLHEHRQRYRRRIQPLPMGRAHLSILSTIAGLASTLKNSIAATERARRSIVLRC